MRDLSQVQFSSGRRNSSLNRLLRLFLIVLVAVGIIFVTGSRLGGGSSGGSSIILQEAPRGLKPVNVEGAAQLSAEGVDLASQTAVLVDVKYGGEAKGVARRSYGDGVYILSVEATLPDPKNTFYQVWLVGGGEVVSIDYMRGSKNTWNFNLRSQDKYSSYGEIWITLERTKDDLPEEHVMEGTF